MEEVNPLTTLANSGRRQMGEIQKEDVRFKKTFMLQECKRNLSIQIYVLVKCCMCEMDV